MINVQVGFSQFHLIYTRLQDELLFSGFVVATLLVYEFDIKNKYDAVNDTQQHITNRRHVGDIQGDARN